MLASVADIKRMLKRSDLLDADLTPWLEAADEWVREVVGSQWGVSGAVSESFYNVRSDELLQLGTQQGISAVSVSVYSYPDSTAEALGAGTFQLEGKGRLRLMPTKLYEVFEGAYARALATSYAKVVVSYTAAGTVPKLVRDACALIAALNYSQSDSAAEGLSSESIGGYSYSASASNTNLAIPDLARVWLRPYNVNLRAVIV